MSSFDKDMMLARLRAIAARATLLAKQFEHGQLWPGDLRKELSEIVGEASRAESQAGNE